MIITGKKCLHSPRETDKGGTPFSLFCLKLAYLTQKLERTLGRSGLHGIILAVYTDDN